MKQYYWDYLGCFYSLEYVDLNTIFVPGWLNEVPHRLLNFSSRKLNIEGLGTYTDPATFYKVRVYE